MGFPTDLCAKVSDWILGETCSWFAFLFSRRQSCDVDGQRRFPFPISCSYHNAVDPPFEATQ